MGLFDRLNEVDKLEVSSMDWGEITPEFCNEQKKAILHLFNHFLEGQENLDRCVRFAIGRIRWYKNILPNDYIQEVMFDDRGQNITDKDREYISLKLKGFASEINFITKR